MTRMKVVDKPGYQEYSQNTEKIREIYDTTFHSGEFIFEITG
jgi:hypothetical protein